MSQFDKLNEVFDQDYFENGQKSGKSNYFDYSWVRLGPEFQKTAKHIMEKFNPEKSLDVGCSKGFMVKSLTDLGVDAYGIDPSQYAIENGCPEIISKLQIGLAQNIDFPDNSFDVVTCFDVLEHIPLRDALKVCKELIRVSREWVIVRMVTEEVPGDMDSSHETIRPADWWKERFEKADGEVVDSNSYFNEGVWWFNLPDFFMVVKKV